MRICGRRREVWGVAAPRDGWPCPKPPSCSEPTPGHNPAMSFALASSQPEAPQGRDGSGGAIWIQAVRLQLYLSQAFVFPAHLSLTPAHLLRGGNICAFPCSRALTAEVQRGAITHTGWGCKIGPHRGGKTCSWPFPNYYSPH